jgi:hypothetical protein
LLLTEIKDKEDPELISFRKEVQGLSSEILDRDLAELSNDIEFLEIQVDSDPGGYTLKELHSAREKISGLREKAEICRAELRNREDSRNNDP